MRYQSDIGEALRDAIPFSLSILLSFVMVGVLGRQQGLDIVRLFVFSAVVMSAPLQWTLLQAPTPSLTFYTILIAAVSINIRFFIYSLALRSSLEGHKWRFAPAFAVMGNAAFSVLAARRPGRLTLSYVTTACFTVYLIALFGTVLGYCFASATAAVDHAYLTVALAIFVAASLGKQARKKGMLPTQCVSLLFCICSLYWLHHISLDMVMMATIASSFLYDRS